MKNPLKEKKDLLKKILKELRNFKSLKIEFNLIKNYKVFYADR